MPRPGTLDRPISPPPLRKHSTSKPSGPTATGQNYEIQTREPTTAAIEAGEAQIGDHTAYFGKHLSSVCRPAAGPRISIQDFEDLYRRNQHSHGRHFVVHQHDHPISGVHYDLRLQFSETSSISFAVPYGLPGNPNSVRPNRMAIETRVHNLWNHLIESASHATGSLLIWDIGEYEVLPRKQKRLQQLTDDDISDMEVGTTSADSQSTKLFHAFQSRHIRLRLRGTKLPRNYTIALRLPLANNSCQPKKPSRKRRRIDPAKTSPKHPVDSNTECDEYPAEIVSKVGDTEEEESLDVGIASEDEEDATIRANNAYTGASNTIGSIHQRRWFLTLDRQYSGFHKARSGPDAGRWVGSWEAFFVRGRDHEKSVVTRRNADEVMADEGVDKFVGRKMWRPITE